IYRIPGYLGAHVGGLDEVQAKQAQKPREAGRLHFASLIEVVENAARLRVQPDVPAPVIVCNGALRHDGDVDGEKMGDPALQDPAQTIDCGLPPVQADGGIEALVAVPVAGGIVAREHVELDRTRRCLLLPQQLAETAEAAALRIALHDLVVRRHERAVLADTDLLASEQYFG